MCPGGSLRFFLLETHVDPSVDMVLVIEVVVLPETGGMTVFLIAWIKKSDKSESVGTHAMQVVEGLLVALLLFLGTEEYLDHEWLVGSLDGLRHGESILEELLLHEGIEAHGRHAGRELLHLVHPCRVELGLLVVEMGRDGGVDVVVVGLHVGGRV